MSPFWKVAISPMTIDLMMTLKPSWLLGWDNIHLVVVLKCELIVDVVSPSDGIVVVSGNIK
jgi:hypothetical protein